MQVRQINRYKNKTPARMIDYRLSFSKSIEILELSPITQLKIRESMIVFCPTIDDSDTPFILELDITTEFTTAPFTDAPSITIDLEI
tara:strand:+ start:456 stop:716 length:261 start_codon:yes stop_codon:yes gene_type:complete